MLNYLYERITNICSLLYNKYNNVCIMKGKLNPLFLLHNFFVFDPLNKDEIKKLEI